MSEKPRTPDPPRKVQAPKARQKAPSEKASLPWTNVLIGLATVAVVGLLVALFVVLSDGSGSAENVAADDAEKVQTAMTAAGCTFTASAADTSSLHTADSGQKVVYKTFPPASGVHNGTAAIHGNYRNPADPRQVLHNLEHGGIAVWYGPDISPQDRSSLDAFYEDSPNGVVITPLADRYPGITFPKHAPLDGKIALSVWTAKEGQAGAGTVYVAVCPSYDEQAFTAFRDAFRGKGPERVPVSELTPGS